MLDETKPDVFQSVFSGIDAFVYRCRNDAAYTMLEMHGAVERIIGYRREEILDNAKRSFVSLIHPDDAERVDAAVAAAVAAGGSWDVDYRLKSAGGDDVWVRERGAGVSNEGELLFLEGLIVDASAEVALRRQNEAVVEQEAARHAEIVKVSSEIADAINMLSLLSINARVEAARSGTAGLGFAVVAEEMKRLADMNADAVKRITKLAEEKR